MPVARHPPHRSVRALLTHTAPTLDARRQTLCEEKGGDRKSTRLNSIHANISYAVFCLKKTDNVRRTAHSRRSEIPGVSHKAMVATSNRCGCGVVGSAVHTGRGPPASVDCRVFEIDL